MIQFGTIDSNGIVTKEMNIDLNSLPSSDPLAFGYGINAGQRKLKLDLESGNKKIRGYTIDKNNHYHRIKYEEIHGAKFSDLAQEYLRGFLFGYKTILVPEGTKIKKGEELCYTLLHLNTYKNE